MTTITRDKRKSVGSAATGGVLWSALALSACLMGVALQSPNGPWLAWFTLVPLFLSFRLLTPGRAALGGAFWGLCLFLYAALAGGRPFAPTPLAFVLLLAAPGAYALVGTWLTRRVGFSPLLLGLGWVGVELALQPLELRNGLLAGTQGHGLVVRTMGYLAGSIVVAFLVAYVNASLLCMLSDACAVGGDTRLVPRPQRSEGRLIPLELPVHPYHLFGPNRPRAPPLL